MFVCLVMYYFPILLSVLVDMGSEKYVQCISASIVIVILFNEVRGFVRIEYIADLL